MAQAGKLPDTTDQIAAIMSVGTPPEFMYLLRNCGMSRVFKAAWVRPSIVGAVALVAAQLYFSANTVASAAESSSVAAESDTASTPKQQSEVEKWLAEIDAKQQEIFQQQVTKVYEAGVTGLRARYLAALDAGLVKASASGQLDQALIWRTEKQNFVESQTPATNDAATSPEIRAMRTDYRQKLAQIELERVTHAKQLFASYDAILVKNSTLLTQRQRLDDALLLHTKRKELAKAWGIENPTQPAPTQPVATKPPTPAPGSNARSSISLLSLTPTKAPVVGYGELILGGGDFYGDSVLVNGEPCTQWLGAHAESKIFYNVPYGTKTFSAYGVRPNNRNIAGTWRYIVRIDGIQSFRSKPLNEYDNFQVQIEVPVPAGAKSIELAVDDLGGIKMDHAVWALPTFKK